MAKIDTLIVNVHQYIVMAMPPYYLGTGMAGQVFRSPVPVDYAPVAVHRVDRVVEVVEQALVEIVSLGHDALPPTRHRNTLFEYHTYLRSSRTTARFRGSIQVHRALALIHALQSGEEALPFCFRERNEDGGR